MEEFNYNGHKYTVVPIEGNSNEYYIIRDDRNTRNACRLQSLFKNPCSFLHFSLPGLDKCA